MVIFEKGDDIQAVRVRVSVLCVLTLRRRFPIAAGGLSFPPPQSHMRTYR